MDDDLAAEHSTHGHGSSFEFAAVTVAKAISASSFSTSSHLDPLELCPPWAPALGFGGAAAALVFASIGSAIGTGKAGMGISSIGVQNPEVLLALNLHTLKPRLLHASRPQPASPKYTSPLPHLPSSSPAPYGRVSYAIAPCARS